MTVRQLLSSMDSVELSEWMALHKIEHEDRTRAELEAKAKQTESQLRGKRIGNR